MAVSRSAEAVLWIQQDPDNRTHAEAARMFGVAQSTISRAMGKRETTEYCACCGQTMKQGAKPGGPGRLKIALKYAKERWAWDDTTFIEESFPRFDDPSMTPEAVVDGLADRYDLFDPRTV